MRDEVRGACELLGLDPLHIANEGQFLAVVAPEYADAALNALHRTEGGEDAVIIGDVRDGTCLRRARDDTIRRQPDRGHAGRRSAAANLLGRLPWKRLASWRRRLKNACSCAMRSSRASSLERHGIWLKPAARCRNVFLRGGRLLAFGRGPYATDAQHVSVEFVHPVIVGKRALPALDLSTAFQPWLDTILQPGRHRDGVWPSRRRPRSACRAGFSSFPQSNDLCASRP